MLKLSGESRSKKRFATIVASTVEVLCPHCGEPQPNPDNGADSWLPEEVFANEGQRTCDSCDNEFRIVAQPKAVVIP